MNKFLIAVVDDEIDITHLLSKILSDKYDVITFNTPKAYLEYLFSNMNRRPDLLICDYDMPLMNGLAMVKKAIDSGHPIPFIVLSGYLTKDNVLEALSYGVFSVLEKPIGVPVLMKNIDSLIKEHRLLMTHDEIRNLVLQLQEAYSHLSLTLEQFAPPEVLEKMIVEQNPETGEVRKHKFADIVLNLEKSLEHHFEEQRVLEENHRKMKII